MDCGEREDQEERTDDEERKAQQRIDCGGDVHAGKHEGDSEKYKRTPGRPHLCPQGAPAQIGSRAAPRGSELITAAERF